MAIDITELLWCLGNLRLGAQFIDMYVKTPKLEAGFDLESKSRFSIFFDKLREVKFYVGQFDFVEQDVLLRQYFSVIQRSVLFYNRAYRLTTTLRTVYLIL